MLRFCVELCKLLHSAGRAFAFEHPCSATSWDDESLRELTSMTGVVVSILDMCRCGMVATDELGKAPVRKTIKTATSVPEIADAFSARCEGGIDMST